MRKAGVRGLAASALLLTALAAPRPADGQEAPTLDRVEELVRAGRTEGAREALLGWWEDARPEASRRDVERGFWLRGILTVDPTQAALDFRRIVLEHPGGRYAAPALFRLAQGAFASGDAEGARRYVQTLERDHPSSPVTREARSWLAQAGDPPPPPASPEDVEAPQAEEAPTAQAEEPAADDLRYSVQLGAFASAARARSQLRRAEDAGLQARIVRVQGSRLLHVRVGRFDSSAAANDLLRRITGLGFVAAVVRDAQQEEPYR